MDELFPDDVPAQTETSLKSREGVSEPVPLPSFTAKFSFWMFVWIGTTLAAVVLGFVIGLFASLISNDPSVLFALPLLLLLVAGGVGAFLMIHIAIFKWMFGIDCSPKSLAGLAGGLTGLSGYCCLFLTVPLGVAGAIVATNIFLKTSQGAEILRYEAWRLDPTTQRPKRNFTIMDLMLRMTAISVLLAFWTLVLSQ